MIKRLLHDKLAFAAVIVLAFYIIFSLLALTGLFAANYDLTSTMTFQPPSVSFWFGTDIFGRDIFSRAVHGAIIALSVGTVATVIALLIGVTLGAVAGYFGGWVDEAVVWLYTTWDSIPYILLLAAFAWVLGPGLINVFLALGLTGWVTTCRLIRSEFIKHKNQEYVVAARALGFSDARVIFHHILPNICHIIAVQFGLCFVSAVKIEVILSFLGLGVEPGTPSWGLMIDEGKQEISRGFWWNIIAATSFMFGLVLSINLIVEYIRESTDPAQKNIHYN